MPAYMVGMLDIRDPSWLRDYRAKTEALIRQYGGRYLVRGGAMEVLEGDKPAPSAMVVVEFPSMEQARAWYNDPEYGPLIALRMTGADLDLILVEGLEG